MLGKRGYDVTILERRADMRRQEVESGRSINLAMSSRGIHALELAGLMEQVRELLIPMRGRMLHLSDGAVEFMPYGQRPQEVIYSVSRRDLNALMMTAAEEAKRVEVIFDQKLETIDFDGNMLTILDEHTGETRQQEFELLIGADGAGSRTRRALMPVVNGQSRSEFLDHDYKELEIPAGPPGEDGAGKFQIEREALHIWPRGEFMLIALPNQDGSFTVTLFMPKSGPDSFENLKDAESVRSFFQARFPDALALMPELETDFFSNPQGPLGTIRCSPWYYQDKALILGDASHAIVPFHGQGMNAGFEDCSELVGLLDEFDDNWERVLAEFDRIRRPNANAIADMALENYVTMRASVVDPKFQLKKEIGFELEKRFPLRFVPRYSMVMFHLVPYADAMSRGSTQQAILDELADGAQRLEDVDFEQAKHLIYRHLEVMELD